jgi:hypothetical protein
VRQAARGRPRRGATSHRPRPLRKGRAGAPHLSPPRAVFQRNLNLIDKYVETRDRLFLSRALRFTGFVRAYLARAEIVAALTTYVPDAARRAR